MSDQLSLEHIFLVVTSFSSSSPPPNGLESDSTSVTSCKSHVSEPPGNEGNYIYFLGLFGELDKPK